MLYVVSTANPLGRWRGCGKGILIRTAHEVTGKTDAWAMALEVCAAELGKYCLYHGKDSEDGATGLHPHAAVRQLLHSLILIWLLPTPLPLAPGTLASAWDPLKFTENNF